MAEPRRIYGSGDLPLEVSEVGNLSTGAVGPIRCSGGLPVGPGGTFIGRDVCGPSQLNALMTRGELSGSAADQALWRSAHARAKVDVRSYERAYRKRGKRSGCSRRSQGCASDSGGAHGEGKAPGWQLTARVSAESRLFGCG